MTPRCGAKKRQGSGTCMQAAGWGTDHVGVGACKLHGGKTPNARKAAQHEQAEKAVVIYGLPREIDPHSALMEELWRTAGHVSWLGTLIAEFEADGDLKQYQHTEVGGTIERPAVWIELYHRERKHFAEIAKTCVAVGIEERRVHLAEQQGQLLAQVIRGVLTDLGVADRPEVPAVVRRHLTLVAASA